MPGDARGGDPAGEEGDRKPGGRRTLSRRSFLLAAAGGIAAVGAVGVALDRLLRPARRPPSPQPPGRQFQSPPRQGPQLPEDTAKQVDLAHRRRMEAFPAPTRGRGGQPLPYRTEGGVKIFELETRVVQWEVEPGVLREAWAYNGVVPGPEIRVREGDRVRVHLRNNLPESTTIHWHGQRLLGQNDQDGVSYLTQDPVPPGGEHTYEFTAHPAGTHMYHSHHNSTKQLALGLLGPLIVEPKDRSQDPPYDREHILVLNDGPLGFTINGKSFPATEPIVAKRGERVRLRWMNEGAMFHPMHIHGLVMEVFARDGWPLPQPFRVDTLNVGPGERWDCIVRADNPGKWAIHCHVLPHAEGEHGMFGLVTVFVVET